MLRSDFKIDLAHIFSFYILEFPPTFIKQYQMDYSNIFVPTFAFLECTDMFLQHHVLMVAGAPGSGKTMIAQQLMLKMYVGCE